MWHMRRGGGEEKKRQISRNSAYRGNNEEGSHTSERGGDDVRDPIAFNSTKLRRNWILI